MGEKLPIHIYAWGALSLLVMIAKYTIKIEANQLYHNTRIQTIELWQGGVNQWKEQTNVKLDSFNVFKFEQLRTNENIKQDHNKLAGEVQQIQDKLKKR